jgi:hypothetical protein
MFISKTRSDGTYSSVNFLDAAPIRRRKDTFTLDSGHLVKAELLYAAPSDEYNSRGQSFEKIFTRIKQAYGPLTSVSAKHVQEKYGVPYIAHHELWIAPQAAIVIAEQPGTGGSTTLVASTRAKYDGAVTKYGPKPAKPLESLSRTVAASAFGREVTNGASPGRSALSTPMAATSAAARARVPHATSSCTKASNRAMSPPMLNSISWTRLQG